MKDRDVVDCRGNSDLPFSELWSILLQASKIYWMDRVKFREGLNQKVNHESNSRHPAGMA